VVPLKHKLLACWHETDSQSPPQVSLILVLFFYRSLPLLFRFSTLVCSVGRRSYTTAREGALLFAPVHLLYGLVIHARFVWLHTSPIYRSYFYGSALAYPDRIEDHDMEPSSSREPPWAEHEKVRTAHT
jgi:hypothetical protein